MDKPTLTHAYVFDNGMVMAFDQHGQQMPGYQGHQDDVRQKIKTDFPDIEIKPGEMMKRGHREPGGDIVDKVAAEIADIPGNPSTREIARIAIEAYRRAIWAPAFDISSRYTIQPELRRRRTHLIVANIMQIISKYLCDHGPAHGARDAVHDLSETLYEVGAEIITDIDRTIAGLPPRGPYGLTAEELALLEQRRLDAMRVPIIAPGPDASGSYQSWAGGAYKP